MRSRRTSSGPLMESLESRRMMAGSVIQVDGVLTITGEPNVPNIIHLKMSSDSLGNTWTDVLIETPGTGEGTGQPLNEDTTDIVINGGTGNDTIVVSGNFDGLSADALPTITIHA